MKTLFRTCLFAALVGCAVAPAAAQSYNESHFYPDGLGGGQLVGPNGTTHFYSDGLGGGEAIAPGGATTHFYSDGLGGETIVGPDDQ